MRRIKNTGKIRCWLAEMMNGDEAQKHASFTVRFLAIGSTDDSAFFFSLVLDILSAMSRCAHQEQWTCPGGSFNFQL